MTATLIGGLDAERLLRFRLHLVVLSFCRLVWLAVGSVCLSRKQLARFCLFLLCFVFLILCPEADPNMATNNQREFEIHLVQQRTTRTTTLLHPSF